MPQINDLKVKLGLPPVSQIGVIVRDVDKAANYYTSLFGVGPFTIYDFEPEQHIYNGEPTKAKIRMGKAMWGNMELELLQPLEGKSPHMDFFLQHGKVYTISVSSCPISTSCAKTSCGKGSSPSLNPHLTLKIIKAA